MKNPPPRFLAASLTFVLGVVIAVTVSVHAWTGPTAAPPGNNVTMSLLGQWATNGSNISYGAGNVEVGAATPKMPLQVGPDLTLSGNWPTVGFNSYWSAAGWRYSTTNAAAGMIYGDYSNGGLNLKGAKAGVADALIAWGPVLTITSTGVGIGTSSPSQTFSVNGTIYATGGVVFPDGTTQSTAAVTSAPTVGTLVFSNVTCTQPKGGPSSCIATCPVGFSVTGGGVSGTGATNSAPSGNGWTCTVNTINGLACTAICAKVQ